MGVHVHWVRLSPPTPDVAYFLPRQASVRSFYRHPRKIQCHFRSSDRVRPMCSPAVIKPPFLFCTRDIKIESDYQAAAQRLAYLFEYEPTNQVEIVALGNIVDAYEHDNGHAPMHPSPPLTAQSWRGHPEPSDTTGGNQGGRPKVSQHRAINRIYEQALFVKQKVGTVGAP